MSTWKKVGSLVLALGLPALATNGQEQRVTPAYRDAEIRMVVQQLGQLTNSSIVLEPGVVGTVSFHASAPMTIDEFRRAILARLTELGYQITERDGVLRIGPIAR